jgi:hypothetical protein
MRRYARAVAWSAALLASLAVRLPAAGAAEGAPAFPIQASADGRYLVDQRGQPFFYHADTAWTIAKKLTPAEVAEYLDDRVRRGFTAIHVHAFSKEQGPVANREGAEPFAPLDDILKPSEAYWRNLDAVIEAARARGLLVALSVLWIRWGGGDREGWRYQLTDANARPYGRFLGARYAKMENLVWILGGDANPIELSGAIAEIAAGIRESGARQPITVHNAPENASAAFFHAEPWLGINLAYTYGDPYRHVLGEYHRRPPVRPIVLGESGYELESNDGRGGEPIRVRRQAYWAILSGALGGHAYGHKSIWRFDADWRQALDAPGARQMAHVKGLFAARAWHQLVPDAHGELLTRGRGTFGSGDHAAAAMARDGSFALAYLPSPRAVTANLARLRGHVTARWFDPASGAYLPIGDGLPNSGEREFTPPEKNAAGDGDFVLVIEAAGEAAK